jgi:hypothetical protein
MKPIAGRGATGETYDGSSIGSAGKRKSFQLLAGVTLMLSALMYPQAQAEPAKVDWFSVKTQSPSGSASTAPVQKPQNEQANTTKFTPAPSTNRDPAVRTSDELVVSKWFEKYDQLKKQYAPTAADQVILARPLMQEEERVKQWTATAGKISKKLHPPFQSNKRNTCCSSID